MDALGQRHSYPLATDLASGRVPPAARLNFRPYWWDAAPLHAQAAALPNETDVAIVGSGFTGLSAALTLSRRGRQCVVLERGDPGSGASTRNGGQIGTGNQKIDVAALASGRGERAIEILREGTRILEFIEHVITTEKIDCDFRKCGRFRGAMRPAHYDSMARNLDDLRKAVGLESFMVPRANQHDEVGSDVFCGGAVIVNDASLHPGRYHAGLLDRATKAGAIIAARSGVNAIHRERSSFRLSTAAGELRSREVIVATDGYTGNLAPQLRRGIVPIVSAQIVTGPIPDALFTRLIPTDRVYGNTNRVFSYFRSAPGERRIIWGGRGARLGGANAPSSYRHLAREMLRIFPELAGATITHAWNGVIGQTYDGLPHIGKTPDGLHFALGYCGNAGVSRATYFGHKIALKVLGDPDGRTAFDGLALPAFPAQRFATKLVPVIEAWMSLRDRYNS